MTGIPVVLQVVIAAGVLAGIVVLLVMLAWAERRHRPHGPGRR
jgi:HAMP domain-containing protein